MTVQIPLFTSDNSFPASYLRLLTGVQATAGVVNASDFQVTAGGGLQVNVAPGKAYIAETADTEGSFYEGVYFAFNDANTAPYNTVTAPISNPRLDQIILRIYDVTEQDLGGNSYARLEWLQGTENAVASLSNLVGLASLPANSLRLAYVLQTVGESSLNPANIENVQILAVSPLARFEDEPAGGDLGGTYPNPVVNTVQNGRTPLFGGSPAGGDLAGSYPNPTVSTVGGRTPLLAGAGAGGDLLGTYPNPSVIGLNGVRVSGAPSAGQVLTATSVTAAQWSTPGAGGGGSSSMTGAKGSANFSGNNSGTVQVAVPHGQSSIPGFVSITTALAAPSNTFWGAFWGQYRSADLTNFYIEFFTNTGTFGSTFTYYFNWILFT